MKKHLYLSLSLLLFTPFVKAQSGAMVNLLSPINFDTTDQLQPVFTWSNVSIDLSNPRIEGVFVLVEVLEGQTASVALSMNTPLIVENNLLSTSLAYPFGAVELEEGKTYGWRVSYSLLGQPLAASEDYQFHIPLVLDPKTFVSLKSSNDGTYVKTENGKLRFTMDVRSTRETYRYEVRNPKNKLVQTSAMNVISEEGSSTELILDQLGNQYFELDVSSELDPGEYTLIVYSNRGKKGEIHFSVN